MATAVLPQLPEAQSGFSEREQIALPIKATPISSSWSVDTLVNTSVGRFERLLGDCEVSYYLPSRGNGVNDMYLHLGFRAPAQLVRRPRVRTVWAILRLRHPLLASKIEMHDYNDVKFVYLPPNSVEDALSDADDNLRYTPQAKDELIDSYLNGSRTLSNNRLSYLMVSQPDTTATELGADNVTTIGDYGLLICATHFAGDGMALHQFANHFFGLLGSGNSQSQLDMILRDEWHSRWEKPSDNAEPLPRSLEAKLPPSPSGRFRRAVAQVDFNLNQGKLVGGHSFPQKANGPRHTIVPTVPFDAERTKKILKNCKAHNVSISSALFAICNVAWAKISTENREMPTMMYSALNLRPFFTSQPPGESYWFLAIGYFNIILPSFLPTSVETSAMMWHRARSAKEQSTYAAKNPMVVSRSQEMARLRGQRARAWAKEDDDRERGIWTAPPPTSDGKVAKTPSTALLGLSLLGNLDGIYKHATFPEIELQTLTTGSRQRSGGMLLFGYTFVGKLWVSLGYDENGFDKEVVDKFWTNVLGGIEEYLVN